MKSGINISFKDGQWSITHDGKPVPAISKIELVVDSRNNDQIECTMYLDEFTMDIPVENIDFKLDPTKKQEVLDQMSSKQDIISYLTTRWTLRNSDEK